MDERDLQVLDAANAATRLMLFATLKALAARKLIREADFETIRDDALNMAALAGRSSRTENQVHAERMRAEIMETFRFLGRAAAPRADAPPPARPSSGRPDPDRSGT